ncbi:glycosyl hydrolase family 20, partial [Streptomyces chartreusis]
MRRRWRVAGVLAALTLLLTAPLPALAQEESAAPAQAPVTVPALADWIPAAGSYRYEPGARLVADGASERRVAGTLADDLRDAGHGTVPL